MAASSLGTKHRLWVPLLCGLAAATCAGVDSARINSQDVAAPGGEPVAVISTWQGGFTLLWGLVPLSGTQQQMDELIRRNLLTEARAHGADRVEIITMTRLPPDHLLARIQPLLLVPGLLNFHFAYASGVAVASGAEAPIGVIEGPLPPGVGIPVLEIPATVDAGAVPVDGGAVPTEQP